MFDVGFLELFLIAIIALLVLGPERLPGAARQAGKCFGKAKRMMSVWSAEIDRQVENEELAEQFKAQQRSIGEQVNSLNEAITKSLSIHPESKQAAEATANDSKAKVEELKVPA